MKILRRFVFIEPVALVMSFACLAILEFFIQKTAHLTNQPTNSFGLTFAEMCKLFQADITLMLSMLEFSKSQFRFR